MKQLAIISLATLATSVLAAGPDPYMGDWQGAVTVGESSRQVCVYMIPYGNGWYEAKIVSEFNARVPVLFHLRGFIRDGKVRFLDAIPFDPQYVVGTAENGVIIDASLWSGSVTDGSIKGQIKGKLDGSFELKQVQRTSPTLGAEPPPGAIVLFDGTNLDEWVAVDPPGGRPRWKILPGGILEVGKGNIRTKRMFRDHFLHIEFRTPYMPQARGQARGNSGVYLQGRYEIQVLDSYGLEGADNECGGIYHVARPRVNMCLPPLQWQTYDITFHAPRFDSNGKKIANARVTVVHNGVVIHDNVEIPGPTGGALDQKESEPGPLMLQDHGNPVQFRNIWVVER